MVRVAYSFILRYYTLVNVPVVVTSFSLFAESSVHSVTVIQKHTDIYISEYISRTNYILILCLKYIYYQYHHITYNILKIHYPSLYPFLCTVNHYHITIPCAYGWVSNECKCSGN